MEEQELQEQEKQEQYHSPLRIASQMLAGDVKAANHRQSCSADHSTKHVVWRHRQICVTFGFVHNICLNFSA